MRDGHPGARGRERGCGAARSVGRPYSGPTALKQLVSLPGMVAWQCAQTRRGMGLCGCHSCPPAQLQPACGSGRVAARGKSPPPNAATRPLQVPHLLMSVHASCIKPTWWKTRALVSVSLPPVPCANGIFSPEVGVPSSSPPFWLGVSSLLQAQLSQGLGSPVFVVWLWQGSGLAGKAFF